MTFSNTSNTQNDDTKPQLLKEAKDPLLNSVLAFVLESKKLSPSSIQRKFRINYNRAVLLAEEVSDNIPKEYCDTYLRNIQYTLNDYDESSTHDRVPSDGSKAYIESDNYIKLADYYLINGSIDVRSPMRSHVFLQDSGSLSKKSSDMINVNYEVLCQLQNSYNGLIAFTLLDLVEHFSGHHRFIQFSLTVSLEDFKKNIIELLKHAFDKINKFIATSKIDHQFAIITAPDNKDFTGEYFDLIGDLLFNNQLPTSENYLTKLGLSLNGSNDNILVGVSMRLTQEKNMPHNPDLYLPISIDMK